MRRGNRRRSEAGFTLIEALLAAGVFTISALGLLALYYTSAFGSGMASKMTDATAAGSSKLEELLEGEIDPLNLPTCNETVTFMETDFTISWSTTLEDVSTERQGNDFAIVEVVTQWTEAPGQATGATQLTREVIVIGGKPL
jgi:Tfp pilus assembly protein PilV